MPTETEIDRDTKKHLSLSHLQLLQRIRCLTFLMRLRNLLFVTRHHITSNLTKFMAT
jgi:hypothetical protein